MLKVLKSSRNKVLYIILLFILTALLSWAAYKINKMEKTIETQEYVIRYYEYSRMSPCY